VPMQGKVSRGQVIEGEDFIFLLKSARSERISICAAAARDFADICPLPDDVSVLSEKHTSRY